MQHFVAYYATINSQKCSIVQNRFIMKHLLTILALFFCTSVVFAKCQPHFDGYAIDETGYGVSVWGGEDEFWVSHWDFGDGTGWVPDYSNGAYHVYTHPGVYQICLVSCYSICQTVTIVGNGEPISDCGDLIGYETNYTSYATNVNFTLQSDTVNSVYWLVNGMHTGSNIPSNQYAIGLYYPQTVNLFIVGDDWVCADTIDVDFTIDYAANFHYYPDNSSWNPQHRLYFFDDSYGTNTSCFWNFGDGSTSNLINPSHTFADAGDYEVCLIASDTILQAIDTICHTVTVGCLDFSITPTTAYLNQLNFHTPITGIVAPTQFLFGDGTTTDNVTINLSHTYENLTDSITACLLQAAPSCPDTICHTYMPVHPTACQAFYKPYPLNDGEYWFFENLSTYAATSANSKWSFYGSYISTTQHLLYQHQPYSQSDYLNYIGLQIQTADSCLANYQQQILFNPPKMPISSDQNTATIFLSNATNDNTLVFDSYSNPTPDSYTWTMGNGDTLINNTPTINYTYAANGNYEVCLSTQKFMPTDTLQAHYCHWISVNADTCIAQFKALRYYNSSGSYEGRYFYDTSYSTDSIVAWHWNFDDGTTSDEQRPPIHLFSNAGNYTICLTVTTANGLQNQSCQQIEAGCSLDFVAQYNTDDDKLHLTINGQLNESILYHWSVNGLPLFNTTNNSTSYTYGNNPNAQYGQVELCLQVDNIECSTVCHTILIEHLEADFTIIHLSVAEKQFIAQPQSSTPIVSYHWNFGDGNTADSIANPIHHYYGLASNYAVCLTIVTESGLTDTKCKSVTISIACQAQFDAYPLNNGEYWFVENKSVSNGGYSDYTWNQPNLLVNSPHLLLHNPQNQPLIVQLSQNIQTCNSTYQQNLMCNVPPTANASTVYFMAFPTANNLQLLAYSYPTANQFVWQMGNGDTLTTNTSYLSYTYPQNGLYDVCVTAYQTDNTTAHYCKQIKVGGVDTCMTTQFKVLRNFDTEDNYVGHYFYPLPTPNILSYHWDFGDGSTADTIIAKHQFNEAQLYTVCLTTETINCSTQSCQTVAAGCSGAISGSYDWQNDRLFLNDLSVVYDSVSLHRWLLNGQMINQTTTHNATDTLFQYSAQLAEYGTVALCLETFGDNNCPSVCEDVLIDYCNVVFEVDTIDYHTIQCWDYTQTPQAISWHWNFGDGDTSDQQNPTHVYTQAGTYLVCLTVMGIAGIVDYACDSITILPATYANNVSQSKAFVQLNPNPTSNYCYLTLSTQEPIYKIILSDTNGKVQKTILGNKAEYTLDLVDLTNGFYVVQIFTRKQSYTAKLIKR
jgi:PKD repeat protein